ncbi:uncharacterized protein LOC133205335 [Saccostrea echinata]|uniref:uncharacterized protein LOC133205335 n=1 Tax=Saccostrea echinata TaxID=191078 RepID=UPI002A7F7988|nr:uncharacterized protein LOC133205335 [Saccostrea echinata]
MVNGTNVLRSENILYVIGKLGNSVSTVGKKIVSDFAKKHNMSDENRKYLDISEKIAFSTNAVYFIDGWFGLWNDNPCEKDLVLDNFSSIIEAAKDKERNIKFVIGLRTDYFESYKKDLEGIGISFPERQKILRDSYSKHKDTRVEMHLKKMTRKCTTDRCRCKSLCLQDIKSIDVIGALSVPDDIRTLCPRDIALDPQYVWIHGSSCLQISLDKHDWPHARERCQRHGGDLVQIRNADMQGSIIEKIRQVHHHIKEGFWIGASDQHHEGRWEWVSGDKTMTYDNWSPHQGPHQTGFLLISGGGTEDCGLLKISDHYMWHDYPCHSGIAFFYPYICQFDIPHSTKTPETTPTPKASTVATTKLTTQSTTKPRAKTTVTTEPTSSSTTLSTSYTKSITNHVSPTVMTSRSSTSTKSTLLSLLRSKSPMAEKTNGITLFLNKNTSSDENPNKPTTEESEVVFTEQGQSTPITTTTKSIPEGMIIIG